MQVVLAAKIWRDNASVMLSQRSMFFRRARTSCRPQFHRFTVVLLLVVLNAARAGEVITLEAENGALVNVHVSMEAPGFSGTGYVTDFRTENDKIRFNFKVKATGPYHLLVRYCSPFGPKKFNGIIEGMDFSGEFPQTKAFVMFDVGTVKLVAGDNTLEIGGGSGWYDIDRVDLYYFPMPLPVPVKLTDAQATPAARELMQKLVNDYGSRTWSGQHEALDLPYLRKTTGREPLIIEGDFVDYSPSRVAHGSTPTNYTENLIALGRQGHVIAFCWHWNAPTRLLDTTDQPWWKGFYTSATTFDVADALANTNSINYVLLLRDIDAIAVQLKKLSDANIPVLWRPLHEAQSGGFWWGAKGPEPFKQMWRLLFNRLTTYHELHNLIWVFTWDNPTPNPAWYPGDDVVDVIGLDSYPKDRRDTLKPAWEVLKQRYDGKKLIALTEFGGVPDVERMQNYGVWWSWFSSWTGQFGPYGPASSPTNVVIRIYQSPSVATLPGLGPPH